jgi:hypothetical protein
MGMGTTMCNTRLVIVMTGMLATWALPAVGQFGVYQAPGLATPSQTPKAYTDYYTQHLQNYRRPPVNVRDYTIDRYYYHNPSLSPYLNLARRSGAGNLNNYYRYVKPEIERRSQYDPARNPPARAPSFKMNPYFNHY